MLFENIKNSNHQGNIGMSYAITYYTKEGYTVSIPMTDSQYYDLIIENNGLLQTVQVKTTQSIGSNCNNYQVGLRTSSGNKNSTTIKDFSENNSNILFVLVETGTMYSIPREEITSKTSLSLGERLNKYKVQL